MRKLTKIIKKRRKNYKHTVGLITGLGKRSITWTDFLIHKREDYILYADTNIS